MPYGSNLKLVFPKLINFFYGTNRNGYIFIVVIVIIVLFLMFELGINIFSKAAKEYSDVYKRQGLSLFYYIAWKTEEEGDG